MKQIPKILSTKFVDIICGICYSYSTMKYNNGTFATTEYFIIGVVYSSILTASTSNPIGCDAPECS